MSLQHPAFAPYQNEIYALGMTRQMPDLDALNALGHARALTNANARPLHFVLPQPGLSARGYETHILQTGRIPTRPDNWHDLMNALVWLRFPRFKAALNAAHATAIANETLPVRGRRRDALTMLDESGVWLQADDAQLVELLEARNWQALFCDRRAAACAHLRFIVVGHALLEKMRAPYPAITGKCLRLPGAAIGPDDQRFGDPEQQAMIELDALDAPQQMAPIPLLGIPGWDAANASPAFYDNRAVFR